GETEADFRDTLKLAEAVKYSSTFFFKYSARPGTPAAELEDQVSEEEKSERLVRLQDVVERDRRAFNAASRGKTFDVWFEKTGRLAGQIVGRSPYLQTVQVMAPENLIGQIVPVTITDIGTNTLFGALASVGKTRSEHLLEMQQA